MESSNFRCARVRGRVLITMESGITLFTQEIKNDNDKKPCCPECSSHIIFDVYHGEYICQSCGYVVLEKMDYCGHESHSNNSDDRL